jgi:hypothetical protein
MATAQVSLATNSTVKQETVFYYSVYPINCSFNLWRNAGRVKLGNFKLVYTTFSTVTDVMYRTVDFFLTDILKLTQWKIGTEFNQLLHLKRNKGGCEG